MKLSRGDVEWLLATHEQRRGPIDWSDENQRGRQGLDLRGADLTCADLHDLPLARTIADVAWQLYTDLTEEQHRMATLHLEGSRLEFAHLEGADLRNAHLEEALLGRALCIGTYLASAHLEGAELYGAHLDEAFLWDAFLQGATLRETHLEAARLDRVRLADARGVAARLIDVR